MSELVRKAETDIEGLRHRLARAGAAGGELSSSTHIHVSRSAQLLLAARSLGAEGDVDAMAAVTGALLGTRLGVMVTLNTPRVRLQNLRFVFDVTTMRYDHTKS